MYPILLKIGPLPIHTYGFLIAVGFITSLFFMRRDAVKASIDPDFVSDTAFWVLLLGLAGTRVLHIIMYRHEYSWQDPIGWLAVWRGGLVFQGALPPAIAYCFYVLQKKHINPWRFADVVCPYIPLGHAFGRLGCFCYGCCYGKRTDSLLGIPFRRVPFDLTIPAEGSPAFLDHAQRYGLPADAQWSYPVHPTQLYEVVLLLAILTVLLLARSRWLPFSGFTLPAYLGLYGTGRFLIEFVRGDHNPRYLGVLSGQQLFCLIVLMI